MKKGFTLIELVIVIVILGILAAVAVPKFADLQKEAKQSAVKGLGGAVNAAKDIVRAKWLVLDNASADNVSVDGKDIKVLNTGYPRATYDGIGTAVNFDADKYDNVSSANYYAFCYKGIGTCNNNTTCGVVYTVNTTDNSTTVEIKTDGCK